MGQEKHRAPVGGEGWAGRRRRVIAAWGSAGIAVGGLALYVREVPLVVGEPAEVVVSVEPGEVGVDETPDAAPGPAEDVGPDERARQVKVARWLRVGAFRSQELGDAPLVVGGGVRLYGHDMEPPWSGLRQGRTLLEFRLAKARQKAHAEASRVAERARWDAESAARQEAWERAAAERRAQPQDSVEPLDDWPSWGTGGLSREARAVPHFQDGRTIGFKIFAIRRDSAARRVGLKNNDVITHVNGQDLSTTKRALEVIEALRPQVEAGEPVVLQILRKEESLTLTFRKTDAGWERL